MKTTQRRTRNSDLIQKLLQQSGQPPYPFSIQNTYLRFQMYQPEIVHSTSYAFLNFFYLKFCFIYHCDFIKLYLFFSLLISVPRILSKLLPSKKQFHFISDTVSFVFQSLIFAMFYFHSFPFLGFICFFPPSLNYVFSLLIFNFCFRSFKSFFLKFTVFAE